MRYVAVVLVLVAVATGVAVSAHAKELRSSCTPGVHPFGDVSARTFCGPAKATLVVGGQTIRFQGGSCQRGPAYVSLNIGTVVLGQTTKPRPDYFGLNVGKVPLFGGTPATHDGTFPAQALAIRHANKGYSMLQATVTLQGGRTHGTYQGTIIGGGTGRGTFHC